MANEAEIRDWLKALGALAAANMPLDQATARVNAYAPLLASQFPAEAFCAASLEAVAAKCEFFPAYATIRELLTDWWIEHRPRAAGLPPPPDGLSETDRHWMNFHSKRLTEMDAYTPQWQRDRLDSLIRTHAPAAWRHMHPNPPMQPISPSVAEIGALAKRIRLSTATPTSAPATPAPAPKPVARPLSPERLAEARKAAGIAAPETAPPPEPPPAEPPQVATGADWSAP